MSNRIELLQQFYNDDPNDPFNLYALALEYQKTDVQKAKELFNKLMKEHETYLPSYYHYGSLLITLHLNEEAKEVMQKGIALAKQQNELKAMREIQFLLDDLQE